MQLQYSMITKYVDAHGTACALWEEYDGMTRHYLEEPEDGIPHQYHRIDGPAVDDVNGSKFWFIYDKLYVSNNSFQEAAGISDEDMLVIILKYGDVS
jgi:hypothetical protein